MASPLRTSTRRLPIRFVPTLPPIPLFLAGLLTFGRLQIYGEDENIYGYSDLVIDVRAASLLSEGNVIPIVCCSL